MGSDPPAVPRKPGEADPAGLRPDPAAKPAPDRAATVRTEPTGKPRAFPFAARARASPYYPALVHPVLRRVLPGAAGAVVLRCWLRGRGGARLVFVNAVLRALALGLIGGLAVAGALDPVGYVALLGLSSLLSAWGVATIVLGLVATAVLLLRRARRARRRIAPSRCLQASFMLRG